MNRPCTAVRGHRDKLVGEGPFDIDLSSALFRMITIEKFCSPSFEQLEMNPALDTRNFYSKAVRE